MKNYTLLLILLLSFHSLLSQTNIKKDSITRLNEVIIQDTLTAKNAIGITPTQRIGKTVFENYSPIDFINSVNQISGLYALSGALNTNRITIRGVGARTPFGTDKLRLYYNNIPVTNGNGFSTIEAYDLENLTSVEVIKGPKGTSFGTNLGGAIILNTKQNNTQQTKFTNSATVGSYGLLKNNIGFIHSTKKMKLTLNYGHLEVDGYRENNRFERDGLLLNTTFKPSSRSEIGFLINHIDYSAQIASSISQVSFDEDPSQAAFTWKTAQGFEDNNYSLIGLSHTYIPNEKIKNTTSIFYTYLDHYEPRPFNILDEYTNGFGARTLFSGNTINKAIYYTFGAELYKDEYHWNIFENRYRENNGNGSLKGDLLAKNKEFRSQINGFGTITYTPTPLLSAQLGLNINKTKYNFKDEFNLGDTNTSALRNFKALFLPSIAIQYATSNSSSIYATISRGFSNPSLEETLSPEGVINPNIVQETGTNYELSFQHTSKNKRSNLDIALYVMPIKNLLVAKRIGDDQYIGRNAGETKHQGIDVDWNYSFTPSEKVHISPFISYTYSAHRFVNFIDEQANEEYSGNELTGVPKHKINTGIQTTFGNGLYANVTHQFIDKIPLTDANTLYSKGFTVIHIKLGYKKQLWENMVIGVDFGINNLTDTTYAQSVLINASSFGGNAPRYFYPGNPTNYYGSLKLRYTL